MSIMYSLKDAVIRVGGLRGFHHCGSVVVVSKPGLHCERPFHRRKSSASVSEPPCRAREGGGTAIAEKGVSCPHAATAPKEKEMNTTGRERNAVEDKDDDHRYEDSATAQRTSTKKGKKGN
jgi:hypothetical protein